MQLRGNSSLTRVDSGSREHEALELDSSSESSFSSDKENVPPTVGAFTPNYCALANDFYTSSEYSASFSSLVISDYIADPELE